jgi:hypothetical protein
MRAEIPRITQAFMRAVVALRDVKLFTQKAGIMQLPWGDLIPLLGEDSGWLWPLFDQLVDLEKNAEFCRALVKALSLPVILEKIADSVQKIKLQVERGSPVPMSSGKRLALWMERADLAATLIKDIGLNRNNIPKIFFNPVTREEILRSLIALEEKDRKR